MATRLAFTVGDHERHAVVYEWNQFTGRERITVDGSTVSDALRMFSVRRSARHEFTVGKAEQHRVEVVKERPVTFAAFRPQTITASVDGTVVARTDATMRRGQSVGVGVGIAVLFIAGMVLQLTTLNH